MSNFFKICERFPPILVRLLARSSGKAMTSNQIAERARLTGLTVFRVESIAALYQWDWVPLCEVQDFTTACHLDFASRKDINRIECYLRKNGGKPTFKYLTKSPEWKTYYLPLLIQWRRQLGQKIPTSLPKPIQRLLASLPSK